MVVNLNLELTDRCNICCPMCSQSLRPLAHGETPSFMSWAVWRQVLASLEGMPDEVHLCPHWLGEPSLHPDFDRMLEYAFAMNQGNRLFRSFKLHTNGILLRRGRAERLLRLANQPGQAEDSFSTVHFSLDADSAQTYQRVKGADRFEEVLENVQGFLRCRQAMDARWPRVHLAFVVQPANAHEAEGFVARWAGPLDQANQGWDLCADWPAPHRDAIYLRRLNCAEQEAADQLHEQVCSRLGLGAAGLRASESF